MSIASIEDGVVALLADPLNDLTHRKFADFVEEHAESECAARRTLLDLIIANRASDGPRLAYACWLEMHGFRERAEFIRVQCELAAYGPRYAPLFDLASAMMPGAGSNVLNVPSAAQVQRAQRHYRLSTRERELLKSSAAAETAPGCGTVQCAWRRGFVAEVEITSEVWLDRAAEILRECPIEKVTLTTAPNWCHRNGAVYLYEGAIPPAGVAKGRRCRNVTPDTEGVGDINSRTNYVHGCLEREFPGIEFQMLNPEPDQIIAALGIPTHLLQQPE